MVAGKNTGGPSLVGRDLELAALTDMMDAVRSGTAQTAVVSGDAGVGKTALVQAACAAAGPGDVILRGAALPLGDVTVPYLGLRSALRSAPSYTPAVPLSAAMDGGYAGNVPLLVDDWLTSASATTPVFLVIDDLHWVDQDTLDVLMYLAGGPSERRLGIICTLRAGELGESHPLQTWLADVRRLSQVRMLDLGPLDRPATESQIAGILGAPPPQSLVTDVFGRTAGNPYFTALLVGGLPAGAAELPQGLHGDLRQAVLRSWRGLPQGARNLTRLLAVAGRAVTEHELAAVATCDKLQDSTRVPLFLQAASARGILDLGPNGTYWFHHPLIAEVLELDVSADERKIRHAAFASMYELQASTDPDPQLPAVIADHYYFAGNSPAAYRWALAAGDPLTASGSAAERLRMLQRAASLHHQVSGEERAQRELWDRIRATAQTTGAFAAELEAVDALLAGMDLSAEPLAAAELLIRRTHLRYSTGQEFYAMDGVTEAVRLSGAAPESWQHAFALAEFSYACQWNGLPGGPAAAASSLESARRAGHPRALSYALTASAMVAVRADLPDRAAQLARHGAAEALKAHDFWGYVHAISWLGNAQEAWTSALYADLMHAGRLELAACGGPHTYVAKLAADEAASHLVVGNWRATQEALRIAISLDPGPMGDVSGRLTAARLALLQGRGAEAAAHLARAEEINTDSGAFVNLSFAAVRAQVESAVGHFRMSYESALAGAMRPGPPPTMCEWLLPLAARALADLAQQARDTGFPPDGFVAEARQLKERFPSGLFESGSHTDLYRRQTTAFSLLYEAELGRVRGIPGIGGSWVLAADAFNAGNLPWEEAYCCRRAAEAMLLQGQSGRHRAPALLRRGLALARELRSAPEQEALERLAVHAHIAADPLPAVGVKRAHLPGLTPREQVILEFVVAGKTYSEIASALVISEKTVSSHISNMLRKTGAGNRVDLARLAGLDAVTPGN
ncbi:helix-turn-helix transcriptional regulator [Pseudarthrobacter niigatensis]|uniref:DNA-binding CsgD family transcriptional regulator/tetratricopeptide (TPR) repeat protein n=1 Tax=Pseudarthrobacter niigatensis TaxID=369935 RepID=A0AAJ1SPL1_9MICC|nr:AAA family ATPase [Pseudarthrobacter niigatensis]MDQ0144534.1 DNA-binding CsgD family transcriptional regulator/tetratricopeptide (TPR) repeat protein [Pseudarthrobacter niigatensis]MDQ0265180.1 DNA-binding CsgD family transcriptional regulator/tetratricopeptide (TPR) repeat protein [Pseudarthrobacter niigatensis]